MGIFRKKEAPEELPGLAVDEITNEQAPKQIQQQIQSLPTKPTLAKSHEEPKFQELLIPAKEIQPSAVNKIASMQNEQGYFKDLIKNVINGTENIEELDSWYKKKFIPGDIVFEMRDYWQKQQPDILLKNISGELKTKLVEKTEMLHLLEKEWQGIYFELLSKEEQIRKEEKELKDSLSEFISLYKGSKNRINKEE